MVRYSTHASPIDVHPLWSCAARARAFFFTSEICFMTSLRRVNGLPFLLDSYLDSRSVAIPYRSKSATSGAAFPRLQKSNFRLTFLPGLDVR